MADQTTEQSIAEIWQLFRETDAKFKETDQRLREQNTRLDRRFQDSLQQIRALEALFTSQWGKLVEALVQPGVLRLFREWGIGVHYVNRRVKSEYEGNNLEVDLILENDADVIVVEVKTILKVQDVNDFLVDLDDFLRFFPKYAGRRIYGAVAGLTIEENADRYAYRRGLFVLAMADSGLVQMRNDAKFRPHDFGGGGPMAA
jgi:hypothetical protein